MAEAVEAPPALSSLQRLPAEILTRIFSELITSIGPSPIHAVLKTCRQFYEIALPLSVHTYRNAKTSDFECSRTRNTQFLRYILVAKPELAPHVKTVILSAFSIGDEDDAYSDDEKNNENDDADANEENDDGEGEETSDAEGGENDDGDGDGDDEGIDDGNDDGGDMEEDEDAVKEEEEQNNDDDGENDEKDENDNEGGNEDEEEEKVELSTPEELAIYSQLIKSAVGPDTADKYEESRSQWISDLEKGYSDAQVALLLLSCPNLQTLWYQNPNGRRNLRRLLKMVTHPLKDEKAESKRPLSRLEDVYQESLDHSYGFLFLYEQAVPFFALPRMRTWECFQGCCGEEMADLLKKLPTRTSGIEEITIRKSYMTGPTIKNMLGACRTIKSFEFTGGLYFVDEERMMARDVMEAVLPHADTLEYLHVNMEDDWDYQWQESHDRLYLGTELRQMTALKTLVMGMQSLTGLLDKQPEEIFYEELPLKVEGAPRLLDCLPDNIEHFEIHACGKAILEQANEFLGAVEQGVRFKNLRYIKFLFNAETNSPEEVQLTCNSPNVELEVFFQKEDNRVYDLIPSFCASDDADYINNIISPIEAPQLREQWLQVRGRDVAFATVNNGLYKAPGIYVPPPKPTDAEKGGEEDNDEGGSDGNDDDGNENGGQRMKLEIRG